MPARQDDTSARLATLEAYVADLRAWRAEAEPLLAALKARRVRWAASPNDRGARAEVIAAGAPLGTPFECGELTDDPKQAQRWGRALGRLADYGEVVDGYVVEWLGEPHRRALWLLRPAEG